MGKTDVQTRTIPGDVVNTNSITEAQVSAAKMKGWEKQLFIGNPPRGEDFHPTSFKMGQCWLGASGRSGISDRGYRLVISSEV